MTPEQVRGDIPKKVRDDRRLRIAGYAALFDRPDGARDTIRPGAFTRTLAEREEAGHEIDEEERELMQRALDENAVIVAQMTPFFGDRPDTDEDVTPKHSATSSYDRFRCSK